MKKSVVAVLCLLMLVVGVVASDTVEAILRPDINISLNGQKLELKDAEGKAVYPLSYNGTTYLPVRAVGESLDLEVGWNNDTKTVILTSKPQQNQEAKIIINQTLNGETRVKGNKNSKVYHMPGMADYNKIKESNIIYFNTEQEAIDAGYKKAKR